jgi:hypothetical protein
LPACRSRRCGTCCHAQHSDHNADYGNLVWLAWTAGLATRVDTWGPPPLEKMTAVFEMNKYDIDARISNEARAAGAHPRARASLVARCPMAT